MKVRDVMTAWVAAVCEDAPVAAAAGLMQARGVGLLVVQRGGRPVGVLTDRDLALTLSDAASGAGALTCGAVMTRTVRCCLQDEEVRAVAERMGDLQLRRLVVLDDQGLAVGVISLGDIARDVSELLAGQTLGEVVEAR